MKEVVNLVAQKAGITEAQAETAVRTVASFLKDRLPPGMAGQVDTYLQGGTSGDSGLSGMAGKVGGMFGKK